MRQNQSGKHREKESECKKHWNFGCICPGQDHDLTGTDRSDAVKRHLERNCFSEKGKAADSIATESTLYDPDSDGTGWYQGTDGWFYYNSPVAPGQNTDNLFDAVKIGNVTKNFDITVYQEAVFAGSYEAKDQVELPVLKGFLQK